MKILRFSFAGCLGWVGVLVNLTAISIHPSFAQLTPDNSLGTERSLIVPLNQNSDRIEGGAIRGINLFHSFKDFNVGENRGVYFANPEGITNIFSRVTGNQASNILGTLGVLGNANLFLLNPNGILFGKNASLDVQGSFVATTANGIQFGNQGIFSATNPEPAPLLTINPSALFFNRINQSATIQNNSLAPAGTAPAGFEASGLRVPNGKSLLLVGGNVIMNGGQLNAYGGRVELGGLAAPGSVGLNVAGDTLSLSFPSDVQLGNVSFTNQAYVDVSGAGKGDIAINAGNLQMSNSSLYAGIDTGLGDASAKGGDININADAISLNSSYIVNLVYSSDAVGNAGNINITTGSLTATNGSQINSFTRGRGNAGDITIKARDAVTFDGKDSNEFPSGSFSNVDPGAVGNGGTIKINAGSLSLTNGGQLDIGVREKSGTLAGGQGIGGTVDINVRDALTISGADSGIFGSLGSGANGRGGDIKIQGGNVFVKDGAIIISNTAGLGDSGKIFITTRDIISLFGEGRSSIQNDVDYGGVGNSQGISINTGSLFLSDLALISSNVDGKGNSGGINIVARDLVSLFQGGELSLAGQPGTLILSRVNDGGEGNGGDINIKTGSLHASNSQITTSTYSKGNAGNVIIEARDEIILLRGTDIFTEVSCACETESGRGGDGKGGDIRITTGFLLLDSGSNLRADTEAKGDAGNIIINARDSIIFSGSSEEFTSGAFSQVEPQAFGRGGDIIINTPNLFLSGDQQINTRTQGQGNAGNIFINANSISLAGSNVRITSGASQQGRLTGTTGKGGDINITTNSLLVTDGAKLSANTEIKDAAGNININASQLTLDNRGSITSESLADANGGNININSDLLLLRRGSQISTSAGTAQAGGNGGNININSKFIIAIPHENSDISANAFTGAGGNIQINSQGIFGIEARPKPTEKSDITASSELGVSGAININVPDTSSIQNSFAGAFPNAIDTNALIANSCVYRSSKQEGTFFITGSGALRYTPGSGLNSIYSTGEVRNVEQTSSTWKKGDPIIEAQGLYQLADGRLILSRECQ